MVGAAISVGYQHLFHITISVLIHLLAVNVVRVFALAIMPSTILRGRRGIGVDWRGTTRLTSASADVDVVARVV